MVILVRIVFQYTYYMCDTHLSVHLPLCGHLTCTYFLAIMNNAAMTFVYKCSVNMFSFLLGRYIGVEFLIVY
jgi:hypothetical protein